jgi:hypothetical protein
MFVQDGTIIANGPIQLMSATGCFRPPDPNRPPWGSDFGIDMMGNYGTCFVAPPDSVPQGLVNTEWLPDERDCRLMSGAVWCGDAAPVVDPTTANFKIPGQAGGG